jgi:2-C-methyl-D-erythritol 2,4-cyclodiphosphate synthase
MRIGHGYDVHRVSDAIDRPLVLGLVTVSPSNGLLGHSDADVVVHALIDAALGAAGLGDIGEHFSDRDPQYAGVASRVLLDATLGLVRASGWRIAHADVTVIAERPRLAAHKADMAMALTQAVGAPVSVKATTNEGLDAVGRGEAIAAHAVCLLEELS